VLLQAIGPDGQDIRLAIDDDEFSLSLQANFRHQQILQPFFKKGERPIK
jgi:hypothetical protein